MLLTLVKVVFILLTLPSTSSSRIELVANATEETSAGRVLLAGLRILALLIIVLALTAAAHGVLDEIHCRWKGGFE